MFKDFLEEVVITEGRVTDATDMESVICKLWNNEAIPSKWLKLKKAGDAIVSQLRQQGKFKKDDKAVHLGSGIKGVTATSEWKEMGGGTKANNTPKTDFMIGDKRISLKMGPSQLMSGKIKGDSSATFYAALKKTPELETEVKALVDKLREGAADNFKVKEGGVRNAKKANNQKIMDYEVFHKEVNKELKEFFKTNKKFLSSFIYEAMSGEQKFGKDSKGCAEYILSCSKDGSSIHFHKTNDKQLISKIMEQITLNVSFKTAGGITNTVIRGGVGELSYDEARMFSKVIEKIKNVFDFFHKQIKKLFGIELDDVKCSGNIEF